LPSEEYSAAWKRERYRTDPAYRAHSLERNRQWVERNRAHRAEYERARVAEIRTNPEEYRSYLDEAAVHNKQWRERQKARYQEFMADKACADCGSTANLDWHHLDPDDVTLRVGNYTRASWTRVMEEVEKCVCLCRSCHKLRHSAMRRES
jgi:hypothetical protein